MSEKTLAVVLKADSSIGTGHLMRVNTILPFLKDRYRLVLITDSLDPLLEKEAFLYEKIIRVSSLEDIPEALINLKPAGVIFDHYSIDSAIETQVKDLMTVAVIDDLADRPHNCDLLFDQWPDRKDAAYRKLVNQDARIYTGTDYAMVKEAFTKIEKIPCPKDGKPRVLLNFGGADPQGALFKTVSSLIAAKAYENFQFIVLSGITNPLKNELKNLVSKIPEFSYLCHVNDVPKLFSRVDLAIGAAGGMVLERITAKIPSICISVASNQNGIPKLLEELGLGLSYDFADLDDGTRLFEALRKLDSHAARIRQRCLEVIDGKGPRRIASLIDETLQGI